MDADILMLIGLNLDIDDIINYCLVNKNFSKVCENKYFWLEMLKNEPNYLLIIMNIISDTDRMCYL